MNFITFALLLTGEQKHLFNNRNLLRGAVRAASHYNGKPHAVGLRAYRPQLPFAKLNSGYGGSGSSIEYSVYVRGMLGAAAVFVNSDSDQDRYEKIEEIRFNRVFAVKADKQKEIWAYKDYDIYAKSVIAFQSAVASVKKTFLKLESNMHHLPLFKGNIGIMTLDQLRFVKSEFKKLQKILKNKHEVMKLEGGDLLNKFEQLMTKVEDEIESLDGQIECMLVALDSVYAMETADVSTRDAVRKIITNITSNPFYSGITSTAICVAGAGLWWMSGGTLPVSNLQKALVAFGATFSFGCVCDTAYLMLADPDALEKFKKDHPDQLKVCVVIVLETLFYLMGGGSGGPASDMLVTYLGISPENADKFIKAVKDYINNTGAESAKQLVAAGSVERFLTLKAALDKGAASYKKSCESSISYIKVSDEQSGLLKHMVAAIPVAIAVAIPNVLMGKMIGR
jgi:hypothetical protein